MVTFLLLGVLSKFVLHASGRSVQVGRSKGRRPQKPSRVYATAANSRCRSQFGGMLALSSHRHAPESRRPLVHVQIGARAASVPSGSRDAASPVGAGSLRARARVCVCVCVCDEMIRLAVCSHSP
jgi:hypothetical protein